MVFDCCDKDEFLAQEAPRPIAANESLIGKQGLVGWEHRGIPKIVVLDCSE